MPDEKDHSYDIAIGNRVRTLRKSKGFNSGKLSIEIKMDHPYLLKLERGEVNASGYSIYRICQGLGITLHEFYCEGLEEDVKAERRKWEAWMEAKRKAEEARKQNQETK